MDRSMKIVWRTHTCSQANMSFLNGLIWQRQSQLVAHSTQGAQKADTEVRESVCVYVCARARLLISQQTKEIQTTDCVKKKSKSSRKQILFNFLTKLSCRGSHSLTVTAERNLDKQHDVIGAFCAARLFLKDLRTIFMSVLHCGMRAKRQRDWHEK